MFLHLSTQDAYHQGTHVAHKELELLRSSNSGKKEQLEPNLLLDWQFAAVISISTTKKEPLQEGNPKLYSAIEPPQNQLTKPPSSSPRSIMKRPLSSKVTFWSASKSIKRASSSPHPACQNVSLFVRLLHEFSSSSRWGTWDEFYYEWIPESRSVYEGLMTLYYTWSHSNVDILNVFCGYFVLFGSSSVTQVTRQQTMIWRSLFFSDFSCIGGRSCHGDVHPAKTDLGKFMAVICCHSCRMQFFTGYKCPSGYPPYSLLNTAWNAEPPPESSLHILAFRKGHWGCKNVGPNIVEPQSSIIKQKHHSSWWNQDRATLGA